MGDNGGMFFGSDEDGEAFPIGKRSAGVTGGIGGGGGHSSASPHIDDKADTAENDGGQGHDVLWGPAGHDVLRALFHRAAISEATTAAADPWTVMDASSVPSDGNITTT